MTALEKCRDHSKWPILAGLHHAPKTEFDPKRPVAMSSSMTAWQRLRLLVGDSFRVANSLSELKSFVRLGTVAKRCSPISTRFSIHDTLFCLVGHNGVGKTALTH